jgi:CDP-glycerol glycerophosphotransferase (TagB/SpsB family)
MWYRLRSKTVIYSYDDLIKIKPTKTQFVLNTMHGSPLKNIGYLAGDSKFKKLWRFEKDFTHILCTSNYFKEVIKKAFGASEEQCLVLGYPRNDFLFYANEKMNRLGIDVGA